MPDDRQIQEKLDELYAESQEQHGDYDEVLFGGRSELQDLSPQEEAEVRNFLFNKFQKEEEKKAKGPQLKWTWDFYGFYLFKFLRFMVEFAIIVGAVYLLGPVSINTSITFIQAVCITTLMALIRQWMK